MNIVWGARARQMSAKGHAKQAWQTVNIDGDYLQYQVARGRPVTLLFTGEAHCAVSEQRLTRRIDGEDQLTALSSGST